MKYTIIGWYLIWYRAPSNLMKHSNLTSFPKVVEQAQILSYAASITVSSSLIFVGERSFLGIDFSSISHKCLIELMSGKCVLRPVLGIQ